MNVGLMVRRSADKDGKDPSVLNVSVPLPYNSVCESRGS